MDTRRGLILKYGRVGCRSLSLSLGFRPALLLANCSAAQLLFSTVWTLRQRGLLLCTALSKHLCSFLWCSQSRTLAAHRVRLHIKLCCFAWTTASSRNGSDHARVNITHIERITTSLQFKTSIFILVKKYFKIQDENFIFKYTAMWD